MIMSTFVSCMIDLLAHCGTVLRTSWPAWLRSQLGFWSSPCLWRSCRCRCGAGVQLPFCIASASCQSMSGPFRSPHIRRQVGLNEAGQEFGAGVLPYQACSCHVLFALKARWGFVNERLGGLRGANEKVACAALVQALLRTLYEHGGFHVTVALDGDWVNDWPRPGCSRQVVSLGISDLGTIELEAFDSAIGDKTARK